MTKQAKSLNEKTTSPGRPGELLIKVRQSRRSKQLAEIRTILLGIQPPKFTTREMQGGIDTTFSWMKVTPADQVELGRL